MMLLIQFEFKYMDRSQFLFNQSSDETLDILKEFLPEIEQQLRQQIEPELEQEFIHKSNKEMQDIERQAQEEFNDALETLQQQFEQLRHEKEQEFLIQIEELQHKLQQKQQKLLAAAQQKFLQDNLDSRILSHPDLQQIADEMQNQIGEMLLQSFAIVRQKKTKELRVRLQSKEQRERTDIDKAIRNEVFSKSGLEELRQQVKHSKVSIASLKSKYNLKINSISKEIQELDRRSKQIAYPNADKLIQQLQNQIAQLKAKQQRQEESSVNQPNFNSYSENDLIKVNHMRTFGANQFQFGNYPQTQFIQEDFDLDSSQSMENQEESSLHRQQDWDIPMPPNSKGMIRHLLSTGPQNNTSESQEQIYLEMPKEPLLKFNVGKMLRQQWQEDDLDRYISGQNQKENKCRNNQEPVSNFSILYQQHLDRLNRNPKPKMRRLSEKAKQHLLVSLGQQRQKRPKFALNA